MEYLEADVLKECDFLIHAFCTRHGGVSEDRFFSLNFSAWEGDRPENIHRNWEIIAFAFNLRVEQFLIVNQVHGDKVLVIERSHYDLSRHDRPSYDAIITNRGGLAIGIKTADCVPIFFVDKIRHVVGVAHAGWKGTSLNIAAKVVEALIEQFSCRAADIIAVIGPSIGPCCYQVDEKVFTAMDSQEDRTSIFSRCSDPGRWMLDLPLTNKIQIISSGVLEENVFSATYCTSCRRDVFYSHRGEGGKTGRQLNFIMLK